ncbi:MAG: hypothetical protein KF809_14195 [Chloroflexi bacterium]|nr:hypothetical protein [Chloroflexota bacterium]
MADLDDLLRRVASGELSPEDAEPLVAATQDAPPEPGPAATTPDDTPSVSRVGAPGRAVRVQVTEGGRSVVNLRIPMSWTGLSSLVPGLSGAHMERVTEALRNGERGRILDIQDDDGDGVIISTE